MVRIPIPFVVQLLLVYMLVALQVLVYERLRGSEGLFPSDRESRGRIELPEAF